MFSPTAILDRLIQGHNGLVDAQVDPTALTAHGFTLVPHASFFIFWCPPEKEQGPEPHILDEIEIELRKRFRSVTRSTLVGPRTCFGFASYSASGGMGHEITEWEQTDDFYQMPDPAEGDFDSPEFKRWAKSEYGRRLLDEEERRGLAHFYAVATERTEVA